MRINRRGVTRIVIELKNVVVKIPNFSCQWDHFLKGIIANIHESRTWKYNSGDFDEGKSRLLCPVIWCSWGGFILIMKKVDQLITEDNRKHFDNTEHEKYFEGDDTMSNYGILQGRLVKIDYGQ